MHELERALRIMLNAHSGQKDKAGEPYVLHPLRLMFRASGTEARAVALLHDVVEDSGVTLEDLRSEGFSNQVIEAVDCLTRREDESYEQFIQRLTPNPLARAVKIEDLKDNMDVTRLRELNDVDFHRLKKYRSALAVLQEVHP